MTFDFIFSSSFQRMFSWTEAKSSNRGQAWIWGTVYHPQFGRTMGIKAESQPRQREITIWKVFRLSIKEYRMTSNPWNPKRQKSSNQKAIRFRSSEFIWYLSMFHSLWLPDVYFFADWMFLGLQRRHGRWKWWHIGQDILLPLHYGFTSKEQDYPAQTTMTERKCLPVKI